MENKKLTPLMRQFMDVKRMHPDKIILFRMGDFFETFFEDARTASKILGITLTSRDRTSDDAPELAGFPYHALDQYLDRLVKAGQKVVIVEQMEDPKLAKGLVKRDIVEIITPGAILDEKLLIGNSHNFLGAVYLEVESKKEKVEYSIVESRKSEIDYDAPKPNNDSSDNEALWKNNSTSDFRLSTLKTGLALLDLSTGDFLFTELSLASLKDELLRQKPREILVENEQAQRAVEEMRLDYEYTISLHNSWHYDFVEAQNVLQRHFHLQTLESVGAKNKKYATIAAAAALTYIQHLRKEEMKHIVSIRYYHLENFMVVDETTRRNLELFASMRNGTRQGSLIDILDETKTPMGARLLQQWMSYPLIDLDQILARQDAVADFKENIAYTKDFRELLRQIGDLSRIISKLATQKVNPRDLLTLASFLESAPEMVNLLNHFKAPLIANLREKVGNFQNIINTIRKTLLPNPVMTIKEGNIIKDGVHKELDELRQISKDGKGWIARLEESEKHSTGIPSLKVGFNKVFGYYIEITNIHKHKVPKNYICKQTLVNCERYISPQLKEHESRVLGAEERIKNIEYEIFCDLRKNLSTKVETLLQYVEIIAQLDVLANFGFVSWQNRYERPAYGVKSEEVTPSLFPSEDNPTLFTSTEGVEGGFPNTEHRTPTTEHRTPHSEFRISQCRHPVIEKLLTTEQFIPNDVYLNDTDFKIALITGPNMAGKSTYLRQIGLCVLMAQIGCFIPCESAQMPIFDRVFTRVGASDNLASGQSTFLVEMIETANILHSATPQSLILLDEIGRGTSTFDGLSLAWAIVEFIHNTPKISAKTLFATHYHELTELENILSGVKNLNVAIKEWNDQIIFIRRIERGGADQSYGIAVARLAGVPNKVIVRAKEILKNLEAIEISPQGLTARIKKGLGAFKASDKSSESQVNLLDMIIENTEEKDKKLAQLRDMVLDVDVHNMTPMQAFQKLEELKKFLTE